MRFGRLFQTFLIVAVTLFGAGAATAAPVKVAMVTSGPTNDQGFNYDALRGIQLIHNKLGWDIGFSESVSAAQQVNVLRQYAQHGYNLIFVHGYEWGDSLTEVAKDFPNVHFAQINSTTAGSNITGTMFKLGELGYFTGMAAGLITKNNKIGVVAAQDAPLVTLDCDKMLPGARSVNPKAEVNIAFVGSWNDVVKGQQVVQAQIDRGVDVLIIEGNAFTPPAIKLAKARGIKIVGGWSGDQYPLAPDTVITSAVQDFPSIYLLVAEQFKNGTLKGNSNLTFGMKDKVQYLGHWGDFVPADVKAKVGKAEASYLAGNLNIGLKF